jgi:8-oxo-dGTP diphosphatase
MRHHLKVSCAVIFRDGKVFAARRGAAGNQPFRWEFPGGKIEAGETAAQCLVRELKEELHINAIVLEELPGFSHTYPEFSIELFPMVCSIGPEPLHASEHSLTGWFAPDALRDLHWADADVQVMEYVLKEVFPRYN